MVVDPTLADPLLNEYASLTDALKAAAVGDIVQLEAGAQIAAGTTVTVSKDAVVVQADPAFGAHNFPPISFILAANNDTLTNLTIGAVTIGDGATGETIENSVILGDAALGYGISETTTSTALNGDNLIRNNRFITTSAGAPANIILANDSYPQPVNNVVNPGLVGGDLVLNNTFTSTVATQFFASGSSFIVARHEGASKDTATTPSSLTIQGNTIADYDVTGASQGIVLIDDTGAVSHNTIHLFANAGDVALVVKDFVPPVFPTTATNTTKHYVTATTNLTVDDNTFETGYAGDGLDSTRSNPDTGDTVYKLELSDNNFVSNLNGLRITGFGVASTEAFGTIDAGGGALKSTGGNDFHTFGGGSNNFAILVTNNNMGGGPSVSAENNVFSAFTPSGVLSVENGTSVDTTNNVTGFAATLQLMFHDELGRIPSASETTMFTNINNAHGPAAVATVIVFSAEHFTRVVDGLYVALLGRPAAPSEAAGWVAMFQRGATEEQVIASICSSAEYYNRAAQTLPGGSPDVAFVRQLYHDLLGRPASASEVSSWVNNIRQFGLIGVALGFTNSAEYRTNQVRAFYGQPAVGLVLQTDLLHRRTAPTSAEVASWVNSALSLLSIEAGFLASPELAMDG
jgi:hypothetical protein